MFPTKSEASLIALVSITLIANTGCRRGEWSAPDGADNGCVPDNWSEEGEGADAPDEPKLDDPVGQLTSTVWTRSIEGCMGTYVTWFALEPGALDVTEEQQAGYADDDGVLWAGEGAWNSATHGVVILQWDEEIQWDDTVAQHVRHWTYAPLSDLLASQLYDDWYLQRGKPWSDAALTATNGVATAFHGEWESDSTYPGGYRSRTWKSIDIAFDGPLVVGGDCAASVLVEVGNGFDGSTSTSTTAIDQFEWSCEVTADAESGLNHVAFGGFSGDIAEVRTQWRAHIAERYDPGLQWAFERAFLPDLWFDPAQPQVLAFVSTSEPLLSQTDLRPPEPSDN